MVQLLTVDLLNLKVIPFDTILNRLDALFDFLDLNFLNEKVLIFCFNFIPKTHMRSR